MVKVGTRASKSLKSLDRSFELDIQFFATHAQALLARRVHDEVFAVLPSHEHSISMAEAHFNVSALGGFGSIFASVGCPPGLIFNVKSWPGIRAGLCSVSTRFRRGGRQPPKSNAPFVVPRCLPVGRPGHAH